MQNEILLVAEAVSGEKGLPQEAIFEAIEQALATATKKRYQENTNIEVIIDPLTGDYETFRVWEVVSDEEFEDQGFQIIQNTDNNEIGSFIKEKIDNVEFGRIAAQAAKQVIVQKVREAERAQVVEKYRKVLGELINGTVKKVTREFLIIDLGEGAEAILSRNELIPGEVFRIGDRLRAVLQEEERENRGPQLALSRKCPEMVSELFKLEVPEISEQVIEIKAVARDPGSRTKIAVKTNDNRIDPVGACVGMRGSRVQAVSNELGNERLDIIIWDDDPAQLLINSMGPVEITSIVLDEVKGSMDVAVTQDTLAQAIGKSGQNVRLSSQITGWKLNVLDQATADENNQEQSEGISNILKERLDVDTDLAQTLISNGFSSLESISSSSVEELSSIEGFDDDISNLLIGRAKEVLITMAMEVSTDDGESGDLMSVEGMEMTLALELSQKGINDREELAELSIEELTSIINITEEDAGDLIMRARAHWFED